MTNAVDTNRAAFEAWLMEDHLLDATWNEKRNCFDEFPAHLAHKAWQASRKQAFIEAAKECRKLADCEENTDGYRAGAAWCAERIEGMK